MVWMEMGVLILPMKQKRRHQWCLWRLLPFYRGFWVILRNKIVSFLDTCYEIIFHFYHFLIAFLLRSGSGPRSPTGVPGGRTAPSYWRWVFFFWKISDNTSSAQGILNNFLKKFLNFFFIASQTKFRNLSWRFFLTFIFFRPRKTANRSWSFRSFFQRSVSQEASQ